MKINKMQANGSQTFVILDIDGNTWNGYSEEFEKIVTVDSPVVEGEIVWFEDQVPEAIVAQEISDDEFEALENDSV